MLPTDRALLAPTCLLPGPAGLPETGADRLLVRVWKAAHIHGLLPAARPFLHRSHGHQLDRRAVHQHAKSLGMETIRLDAPGRERFVLHHDAHSAVLTRTCPERGLALYPEALALAPGPLDLPALAQACAQLWAVRQQGAPIAWGAGHRHTLPKASAFPAWLPGLVLPSQVQDDVQALAHRAGQALSVGAAPITVGVECLAMACIFGQAIRLPDGQQGATAPRITITRPDLLHTAVLDADHPFCATALRHLARIPHLPATTSHPLTHGFAQQGDPITAPLRLDLPMRATRLPSGHAQLHALADWNRV